MEKEDIIRVNLLIMRTLWDVYFKHVKSPDDKATDFYEFLGQGSTKTSNIINGTDSLFKEGVKKGVAEKTGMSTAVLGGKHLFRVWGSTPLEFLEKGIHTEEGAWNEFCQGGDKEWGKIINKALYKELKKQAQGGGMIDIELAHLLQYMKAKKKIIKKVQEEIQNISLSILKKCTPTELSQYEKTLREELCLVQAIRVLQTSPKMKSRDMIEEMEEESDEKNSVR